MLDARPVLGVARELRRRSVILGKIMLSVAGEKLSYVPWVKRLSLKDDVKSVVPIATGSATAGVVGAFVPEPRRSPQVGIFDLHGPGISSEGAQRLGGMGK
jgi:hypothetical protein